MYAIKKNVQLPDSNKTSKYPFAQMMKGDCFDVPFGDVKKATLATAFATARNKGLGQFRMRTLQDEQVYRVWKIA